jgi:RNA polymerase sigma-70 factor (ECF subfamily)
MSVATGRRTGTVGTASGIRIEELEGHRRELTGYCYRMLGSAFEAEDAVQETMLRAWRAMDTFEGRASVRSWVYRIATHVCLDMLRGRQRRAWPVDLGPASTSESDPGPKLPEQRWVTPFPDSRLVPEDGDPAEVAAARESIRLAFVAALQYLPARQRAVLILHEVLKWQATEVAELLDTTVAAVNSALQRARATLADREGAAPAPPDGDHGVLLARYVDAFERYDIEALVALLREDAIMTMPPYDFWLRGPVEMSRWFLGQGIGCKRSRLLPIALNGSSGFASYRTDPAGGYTPFALQIIEVSGACIAAHINFVEVGLFEAFGLPMHLDADGVGQAG